MTLWKDATTDQKELAVQEMLAQVRGLATTYTSYFTQQGLLLKELKDLCQGSEVFAGKQVEQVLDKETKSRALQMSIKLSLLKVALGIVGASGAVDALAHGMGDVSASGPTSSKLVQEKIESLQHQTQAIPTSVSPAKPTTGTQRTVDEVQHELRGLQQKSGKFAILEARGLKQSIASNLGNEEAMRELIEAHAKDLGEDVGIDKVKAAVLKSIGEIHTQSLDFFDEKTERLSDLKSALETAEGKGLLDRYTQRKAVISLAESRYSSGTITRELGFSLSKLFPDLVFQRKRAAIRALNKLGMTMNFRGVKGEPPELYYDTLSSMDDQAHVLPAFFALKEEKKKALIESLSERDEELDEEFLEDLACISRGEEPKHDPDRGNIPTQDNPVTKQAVAGRRDHYIFKADEKGIPQIVVDGEVPRRRAETGTLIRRRKAATSAVLSSFESTEDGSMTAEQQVLAMEKVQGVTLEAHERAELKQHIESMRRESLGSIDCQLFEPASKLEVIRDAWASKSSSSSSSSLDSGRGLSPTLTEAERQAQAAANRATIQDSMDPPNFDDFEEPGLEEDHRPVQGFRKGSTDSEC